MHRRLSALTGSLLLLAAGLLACGGGGKVEKEEVAKARTQEWASLQESKRQLDAKRAQLAELRGRLEETPDLAPLKAQADQLEEEIGSAADALGGRLINHINSLEIEVGAVLSPDQQAALRMKSDEDMVVAREFIERGGDYRRAIDIYQAALQVDPDNQRLKDELAAAEANRWMTQERFVQVKKGMSQNEVRKLLGPPNLHNIHDYPEKQTVAWLYPKGPDRSAAGVYFQKKGDGPYKVYLADFNAVKAPPAQGGPGP